MEFTLSRDGASIANRKAVTQRIALRTVADTTHIVHWLLGDHLGSTSVVATTEGAEFSRTLYKL